MKSFAALIAFFALKVTLERRTVRNA